MSSATRTDGAALANASPMRRRRWALSALFSVTGLVMGTWVTRTPDIRDLLGASTADMGLILFAMSLGSMVGIGGSEHLVHRFGARAVIATGMAAQVACLPTLAFGASLGAHALERPIVALGLLLFGLGMGSGEVAMNVEGAVVEAETDKPFLPTMHGFFSLGLTIGAGAGLALRAVNLDVRADLGAMALLSAATVAVALQGIPAAEQSRPTSPADQRAPVNPSTLPPLWRDRRLLIIGIVVAAISLAEGAANDWLPLVMVDGHGLDPAMSSAVYSGFPATMAIGRFVGGHAVRRHGIGRVLSASAVLAAVGILAVVVVNNVAFIAMGVILWGIGVALGFPLAISAASASGQDATARVAFAARIGYLAFLVGPPTLGLIGQHEGLRAALIVPFVAMVIVATLGTTTGRAPQATRPATLNKPAQRTGACR